MNFVLDNSVTMRWCFGNGTPSDLAYAHRAMSALAAETATVPAIWGLEVSNVLVRAEQRGVIDAAHSGGFLATLRKLRIRTDTDGVALALSGILDLARRFRLSAYDAAYLELAVREQVPLATLDADLRKAARRASVKLF